MPDTAPLSIAEQLALYGDAVEASYGPPERRHSANGGPVPVIDLRGDGRGPTPARAEDVTTADRLRERPSRRSRLLLVAAVVFILALSAAVLAGLLNQPDNLVTDDIQSTTTTDGVTTTSRTTEPEPEALGDADAATIPAELRALSTSSGWVPVSVSFVRIPGGGGGPSEDEHYASEVAAFHTTDPAVLYLWIVERGSPSAAGDAASIDAAVPWGDGLHSGLSWVEGDERYLFQASALDDRHQAPTGSALKDLARTMSPGPAGWDLPGAELVARDRNDGPDPAATAGGSDYAQITWALTVGGRLDLSHQVTQTTRRGDLTDMISELHEASSLGPVRLLPAADGSIRFVMDEGETQRYGLAFVGSTVVNWQGPAGPALDQLITDTAIVADAEWNRAWVDAADLVQGWVAQEGDSTPAIRLVPDESWEPISAVDPGLWSPMEQFEKRTQFGSPPGRRHWIGLFQRTGTTSLLPDVVVSVETSDSSAPLFICEGSWVATTLGPEACASRDPGDLPGPGSSFLVSGDGWYVNLSSPRFTLDELASFSNDLDPRGDVVNGFDHTDSNYRLSFESSEPEQWGEVVSSTWVRDDLELWLRIWTTDRGSFIERMSHMTAVGLASPLEEGRFLIRWPEETRITWFHEEGSYEATVGWNLSDRAEPSGVDVTIDAAIDLIDGLTEIDRDRWRLLIEPINEPYVDPYSAFVELSEEEFRAEYMDDGSEE